jgi:hypothetical protein
MIASPRMLPLLLAALLLVGAGACSQDNWPSPGYWPEVGSPPGGFNPGTGVGPGRFSRADLGKYRDAGRVDSGARDGRTDLSTGSCGSLCKSNEYCLEYLTPFSARCVEIPAGCTRCDCLIPFSACSCVPPPGAIVVCP